MIQLNLIAFLLLGLAPISQAFVPLQNPTMRSTSRALHMSSYSTDASDYSSSDSDYIDDDDMYSENNYRNLDDEEDDVPTVELQPVPMSKNSGNRFVALVWDRLLDTEGRDQMDRHDDRIALTEDHVMFCRKCNLYNETFNTDSMVDVVWSRQVLSSDVQRTIGGAYCMESTKLEYIMEHMKNEPIIKMLTKGDVSKVPLYRWRHIRDYSLRIDDGRFGSPCMLVGMEHDPEEIGTIEPELRERQLEALIRSERVIAAGPLHLPTEFKDDKASALPVGDLIFFNAKDRADAIEFAESLPSAQEGIYKSLQVNFYNTLDTTGKFVSEDPMRDTPCSDMQEALEIWGYPTGDDDTPWLNW